MKSSISELYYGNLYSFLTYKPALEGTARLFKAAGGRYDRFRARRDVVAVGVRQAADGRLPYLASNSQSNKYLLIVSNESQANEKEPL